MRDRAMTVTVKLPGPDGTRKSYTLHHPARYPPPDVPLTARTLFAAAHVVADPEADNGPGKAATLDWEATLRYRHHLWSYGLGVAEAMDTAQRGMGLDWAATRDLIERSLTEARSVGGPIACGAGTDQLSEGDRFGLDEIVAAYHEQCAFIEARGGRIILMASRALAATARDPEDYARVYARVLEQVAEPVILHWLGDMFDPKLAGYWGAEDWRMAMDAMLAVIEDNRDKVDGMKMSLLDDRKEIVMRRRLPAGVKMYTGDDFNYPSLIKGDDQGHSHALLGIFDAIAPAAAAAVAALQAGRREALRRRPRPHRAAVAAHLRGAHLQLQDRAGVPGLPQRPSGSLPDGRWAGNGPFAGAPG